MIKKDIFLIIRGKNKHVICECQNVSLLRSSKFYRITLKIKGREKNVVY